MEFKVQKWKISHLIKLYGEEKINLIPNYQRNPIWSKKAQQDLIYSIKMGYPLPSFFILELGEGIYEMVDGQQRSRAILRYFRSNELDEKKSSEDSFKNSTFLEYPLSITLITKVEENESIEEFYYLVNSLGLHLNRPEKLKAKYNNSNLLHLVEKIIASDEFKDLDLFSITTKKRMLDRDFVEELIALLAFGITEKKKQVDKFYNQDVTSAESKKLEEDFFKILKIFQKFNESYPIKDTRYRQRNDFYTLFSLIKKHINLDAKIYEKVYKTLLIIQPLISPSEIGCKPLNDYAFNCVSQSNSEKARLRRFEIFENILFNNSGAISLEQTEIMDYLKLETRSIKEFVSFLFFDEEVLQKAIEINIED